VREELEECGFVLCPGVVSPTDLARLLEAAVFGFEWPDEQARRKTYAIRHLLTIRSSLAGLLEATGIDGVAAVALNAGVTAVDATFFDKNAETNWKVPAHQDVVVPAAVADGTSHVFQRYGATYTEPSSEILGTLVAARVHFDDCAADNGALYVLPGSHRQKLPASEIAAVDRGSFVACPASMGDVLLMKPMLVHRSSPSQVPSHRRVLHVLYGPKDRLSSDGAS